jgi:predicted aminopeptidase
MQQSTSVKKGGIVDRRDFPIQKTYVTKPQYILKNLVIILFLFQALIGCSTVGRKMASFDPSITSIGNRQYSITYYAQSLPEAANRLKNIASTACKGRRYATDEYNVDDWRPIYVAVQARISCK